MPDPLRKAVAEDAYDHLEDLILKVVFKFQRRYGGDAEDLIELADMEFTEAVNDPNFDETKSKFSTYLWNRIWFRLQETLRSRMARRNRLPQVDIPMEEFSVRVEPKFDLDEYCERKGLTKEAKEVIRAVLEEPIDLQFCIRQQRKPETPAVVRRGLKEYLKDLGWSLSQIRESFREIRESL